MDPKLPTPPAPYQSNPVQPAIRPVPEGSGPRSGSVPSAPSGSGKVQNHPAPFDASPSGNSLGAFPKTAQARADQCRNRGPNC